jgi:hypothetical protein
LAFGNIAPLYVLLYASKDYVWDFFGVTCVLPGERMQF